MIKVWIGIDIGSSSTKVVLINKDREIVESVYIRSKDIDSSIKAAFEKININKYKIMGVGVTGSGREYTKHLINADIVKTEIIAHAIGTLQIIPDVRTIIDIGCEDCKIILLEDGVMKDFNMNTICSSGMGSTLENIASRLGIKIEVFGDLAIRSDKNIILPMKCGVLMSSSIISKKNSGEKIENILMATCNAVVNNFLSLTSKGKNLKEPIVFQGMTAYNKGLIKAFEENLNKKITIPPKPELMGGYGMAIITQEEMGDLSTKFNYKLENIEKATINHNPEECIDCGNCYHTIPKYFQKVDDKVRCIKKEIDKEDLEKIKEIAKACPSNAIKIE